MHAWNIIMVYIADSEGYKNHCVYIAECIHHYNYIREICIALNRHALMAAFPHRHMLWQSVLH